MAVTERAVKDDQIIRAALDRPFHGRPADATEHAVRVAVRLMREKYLGAHNPDSQLGILCPTCGCGKTQVTDSRKWEGGRIHRKRRCSQRHTFSTFETAR